LITIFGIKASQVSSVTSNGKELTDFAFYTLEKVSTPPSLPPANLFTVQGVLFIFNKVVYTQVGGEEAERQFF
jgi:hypothetical protein